MQLVLSLSVEKWLPVGGFPGAFTAHCEDGEKNELKTINKTEKTLILIGQLKDANLIIVSVNDDAISDVLSQLKNTASSSNQFRAHITEL